MMFDSGLKWDSRLMWVLVLLCLTLSCRQDMHDQPRYEPLEESPFFADRRSSRPVVEGTVARGQMRTDEHLYSGTVAGEFVESFPFPIQRNELERGRERYNIFCSPCHDQTGRGEGVIVERGFPRPPSFHTDRLRDLPVGHFFDVITNGYGRMYSYSSRIPVRDRWMIVGYIRALQFSQNVPVQQLSQQEREQLSQEEQQ